ncbi:hypothetical protein [Dyadobacter sp. CY312]|uniref:hypothetical protein n=1 Tax=Dyadobacter sp. CY312 TaxID=2907303 RepID=UPI001F217E13|nr:hypothetical protein [Dyadobacter sp. CY312]MCE7038811.1 hypothetical protein [Dyadobacter sp. CY312]
MKMKKTRLFVTLMLALFCGRAVVGNAAKASAERVFMVATADDNQERVEVEVKNLPEKVKASVGHDTELAWTILKAYLITNTDKTQYYELFVQKPDGETWMKVDKEGKVFN